MKRRTGRVWWWLAATTLAVVAMSSKIAAAQDTPDNVPKERRIEVCTSIFEEAQLKERRARLVFARRLYGECASPNCPKQLRDDCVEKRSALDRALPTVTLVVRDAKGQEAPTTFRVDGERFEVTAGRATPIDPGEHEVEYLVDGQSQKAKITVYEGEKSRLITLPWKGITPATAPSSPPKDSPPPDASKSPSLLGPLVFGGVGVAKSLVAVGVFVLAGNEADKADEQRAASNTYPENDPRREETLKSARSHEDASESNTLVGAVILANGLITIGIGVAWYFLARPKAAPAGWRNATTFAF